MIQVIKYNKQSITIDNFVNFLFDLFACADLNKRIELLFNIFDFDNANKVKNVDCVLTHTCTTNMIPYLIEYSDMYDPTNSILDELDKILTYKHWYFGHWHKDIINIDKKHTCLYNKIIQLI